MKNEISPCDSLKKYFSFKNVYDVKENKLSGKTTVHLIKKK